MLYIHTHMTVKTLLPHDKVSFKYVFLVIQIVCYDCNLNSCECVLLVCPGL